MAARKRGTTFAVKTGAAAAAAAKTRKGGGKAGKGDYRHARGGKFAKGGAG